MTRIQDASLFTGKADEILFPSTENEITEILRRANSQKIPVTIAGAGTGLTGGRVPLSGILLSTEKLDKILTIHWEQATQRGSATVQPAVTLKGLEETLEPEGFFYPPDPGEKTAFLGGTVATNASGPRSYKYGPTRRYVKRLRVALPSGEFLHLTRGELKAENGLLEIPLQNGKKVRIPVPAYAMPKTKNVAGYYANPDMDLIDLFIGSEGTLGVFTEIELEILKAPEGILGGILFFDSEKGSFRFPQQAQRLTPRLMEFFDSRSLGILLKKYPNIPRQARAALFFEQECRKQEEEAAQRQWIRLLDRFPGFLPDPWFSFQPEGHRFFRDIRGDLPVLVNEQVKKNGFQKIGTDMAVPGENAEAMFDFYLKELPDSGIDFCIFGHLGDNNLHVNLLPKTPQERDKAKELYDRMAERAIALKGTISAEHGIGKVRIPYLVRMVGEEGLKEMARVKKALDPNGILNPGNLFPSELLREV